MIAICRVRLCLFLLLLLAACQPAKQNILDIAQPSLQITSTASETEAPLPTNSVAPQAAQTPYLHPILGDAGLRQAIDYCTDRSMLIRSVYPWLTETASYEADSFLPRSHWAYSGDTPDFTHYSFSPELGMSMLDRMGWKLKNGANYRTNANGETLTLTLSTTEAKFRQTWTTVWEEQMKACGIQIIHNYKPAEWLYGAESGLARRDFEIAAFLISSDNDLSLIKTFTCDQIPTAANHWQGQNFSGWCSQAAQDAIRTISGTLSIARQGEAYAAIQREFSRDLPIIPLFYQVDLFAINPALENFVPPDDGIHTWNAAQWSLPGKNTIVIGADAEPAGLTRSENAYIADVIRTLISGRDVIRQENNYKPVLLTQVPSLENGGVEEEMVMVREGDRVVDATGKIVEVAPEVIVRDMQGQQVMFSGGEIPMRRLVVNFEFVNGLTWSDGTPVSQGDYELGYQAQCGPANLASNPVCEFIEKVEFLSDTVYRVTWKPGYEGSLVGLYFLPPFNRIPAHQTLSDGRKLADVPLQEWSYLDEVKRAPLGVGPYVMKEWVYGKSITLEANPFYFEGPVATPHILVKFIEHEQAITALLSGNIDILDCETLSLPDVDDFQMDKAQAAGKIRLIVRPSSRWEQLTFAIPLP